MDIIAHYFIIKSQQAGGEAVHYLISKRDRGFDVGILKRGPKM